MRPSPYTGSMDREIDTQTADYTGARQPTLMTAVWLRLVTPLGSWWADPSLGSRLHELIREKDVARVYMLARQYAEQALAPLLADRRATAIRVEAAPLRTGWLQLSVAVDQAAGDSVRFTHPVKVV